MSGSNFPNGSLVMRIWRFDGSGEMIAKFQYFSDALKFAEMQAASIPKDCDYFMLAVCDYENKFRCFFRPEIAHGTLPAHRWKNDRYHVHSQHPPPKPLRSILHLIGGRDAAS